MIIKEGEVKKYVMSELFDYIFGDENIKEAIQHFSKKKDSCGMDGIYLSQLEEYWSQAGKNIVTQLIDGSYHPEVIEEYELLNKKGKQRYINKLSSIDKIDSTCNITRTSEKI